MPVFDRREIRGLGGDILFFACSPQRMQKHVSEIQACIDAILANIRSQPSDQYTDIQALTDFDKCCLLVRRWMSDCPLQTLGAYKRWCTDKKATITQALEARRSQEAQLRQPQCLPVDAQTQRCNYVPPGFQCQPLGTQAGVVWYQCVLAQPVIQPGGFGPTTIIPSPPPDLTPIAPGPGGPLLKVPEDQLPEFTTTQIATSGGAGTTDVLKKALPWVLLIGAGIAAYYLARRYIK
jgi:hypothetical protein